nr:protein NUCLEAR FUSION DEFECTIVE 5, mitochondrial [Ipomoea batatas]
MNLKHFITRRSINCVRKLNNTRILSQQTYFHRNYRTIPSSISSLLSSNPDLHGILLANVPKYQKPFSDFGSRFIHTAQETVVMDSETGSEDDDDDSTTNEFLSRFVWIMRKKLNEAYPGDDKNTIDAMLLSIVKKVASEIEKSGAEQTLGEGSDTSPQDFSPDLWRTVWEVSNSVLDDMQKATRKEKLKGFLQSEEVKEMYRFAGEIGIRGEMLRELRFKWAREKMEESEFYGSLEKLREQNAMSGTVEESKTAETKSVGEDGDVGKVEPEVTLPKRHGKIKYKIYGLDLSSPKWADVADKIHEAESIISPQELKPISGKCKLVTEKILSLPEHSDPAPLLAEWVELLQPSRVDWISLLDNIKEQNAHLYFKIAEHVLDEESFQTNISDYSKLIYAHAKENQFEDAERILKKMNDKGLVPDIATSITVVQMYGKSGNVDQAQVAFENLIKQGFRPNAKMYTAMIMAYVNAGEPKKAEPLIRNMEARDIKPTQEMYMALLTSYAQRGDTHGAERISNMMQFAGYQPSLESHTLLIEAYAKTGHADNARHTFDYLMKLGNEPDDRCTASMIAAYEKKNNLDKALKLLLELEERGFKPGVATYSVLVDWLSKLQLIDEAEQVVDKITELGETPPFKVNVSLCAMYASAGAEKKALQALSVVEAKKEQLGAEDFDRVINGLEAGGFKQEAARICKLKEAQGFANSAFR